MIADVQEIIILITLNKTKMGCQSTKCSKCSTPYPACQLVNGVCSACRAAGKLLNFCKKYL